MTTRAFDRQKTPEADRYDGIILVPAPTRQRLNEKQRVNYRDHRRRFVKWLLAFGKDPDTAEGYARDVVERRAHDTDAFYRWVWDHRADGYTTAITTDQADEYVQELALADYSDSHKSNVMKSLQSLFEWRDDIEAWDPPFAFGASRSATPRDYLTRQERTALREAALSYDSIPAYAAMSPEERQRWKEYLARHQLGKPVENVCPADFEDAESFKYASLVATSLDAGLRPAEVGRARVGWVDTSNAVLRIPEEQSTKNRENWVVSLRESTADLLQKWLRERSLYDKYEESDRLWLTRHGNPYGSGALKYVIETLAEVAGIDTENRSLSWYSIRHSVGTYMVREEGLAAAQSQLRHTSAETTMKYDQAPVEDRRDALNRM
jgi:integrase